MATENNAAATAAPANKKVKDPKPPSDMDFITARVESWLKFDAAAGLNRLVGVRMNEYSHVLTAKKQLGKHHSAKALPADHKDYEQVKNHLLTAEQLAEIERVVALHADKVKGFEEEHSALKFAKFRVKNDVEDVTAAVLQFVAKELFEHTMKHTVSSKLRTLKLAALRSSSADASVESLVSYPLFSALPSWRKPLPESHYAVKPSLPACYRALPSLGCCIDKVCDRVLAAQDEQNRDIKKSTKLKNYVADICYELLTRINNQLRMLLCSCPRQTVSGDMVLQVVKNIYVDWYMTEPFSESLEYYYESVPDPAAEKHNLTLHKDKQLKPADLPHVKVLRARHCLSWEGTQYKVLEDYVHKLLKHGDSNASKHGDSNASKHSDKTDVVRTVTYPRVQIAARRHVEEPAAPVDPAPKDDAPAPAKHDAPAAPKPKKEKKPAGEKPAKKPKAPKAPKAPAAIEQSTPKQAEPAPAEAPAEAKPAATGAATEKPAEAKAAPKRPRAPKAKPAAPAAAQPNA